MSRHYRPDRLGVRRRVRGRALQPPPPMALRRRRRARLLLADGGAGADVRSGRGRSRGGAGRFRRGLPHALVPVARAKCRARGRSYRDRAEAELGRVGPGRIGDHPDHAQAADRLRRPPARRGRARRELHHQAHERCFIANTLNCEIDRPQRVLQLEQRGVGLLERVPAGAASASRRASAAAAQSPIGRARGAARMAVSRSRTRRATPSTVRAGASSSRSPAAARSGRGDEVLAAPRGRAAGRRGGRGRPRRGAGAGHRAHARWR